MSDYTEIAVVLDRSGSMATARTDHEGGLRSFVDDQKDLAGEVRFTLIQFDSQNPCEIVYDGTPIHEVGKISLIPRGGTPLLDAIGQAVAHVGGRLDKAQRKPDQVLVMVITDGHENASREFRKETVKKLIQDRESAHGWKFLFLGANVDAFAEAGALGVHIGTTMDFNNNAVGTRSMYSSTSSNVRKSRLAAARGEARDAVYACLDYTQEQREEALSTTPKGAE